MGYPSVVRPLGARVLVRRDPVQDTTASGLVIPDRSRHWPQEGTVVACGDGCAGVVAPGDRVLVGRFAGVPAGPYHLYWERDLMAVLEHETATERAAVVRAAREAYLAVGGTF